MGKKDIANKLKVLGLDSSLAQGFLNFVHEKFWEEALNIYSTLEIVGNSFDSKDKAYFLIRTHDGNKDVNLEIYEDKITSFCNCGHREDSKGCAHSGAVLLHKLLEVGENDFKESLKNNSKAIETKSAAGGLGYLKDLFPTKIKEKQRHMVYFNFEKFSKKVHLLRIQKGIVKKNNLFGLPLKFYGNDFDEEKWDISKNAREVLKLIEEGDNFGKGYEAGGFSKSMFEDVNTDLMMPILRNLYLEEENIFLGASFDSQDFKIVWKVKKNKSSKYVIEPFFVGGGRTESLLKMDLLELGKNSLWVFDSKKRCFYMHKDIENLDAVRKIIRFPKPLDFTKEELNDFFKNYYQKIIDSFELKISPNLIKNFKAVTPTAKIYLERHGNSAKIKLRFDYLNREIDYFSLNREVFIVEDDAICEVIRDFKEEGRITTLLKKFGVRQHKRLDEFLIEGDLLDFINDSLAEISKEGIGILGEENLFDFKLVKNNSQMNMSIGGKSDWFELKGQMKFGKELVDTKKVFEAIFSNKRFVDLADDKKGIIPQKWIDKLKTYSGFLDLTDGVRISKQHVSVIEELIEMSSDVKITKEVQKVLTKFKEFDKIKPAKLSKNLKVELRDYQKTGYDWLNFLKEYNFNGILADDMGLGKTIQAISLLQKLKEEKAKEPFLVVVPTSLIFNWKNEIKKFAPGLSVYVHHGDRRSKTLEKFEKMTSKYDLIITSYGIVRNDLELFTKKEFEYIILDEAQIIKNPLSIGAKSVYALKGKNKLIISGTPIQNNLTELWSLFHFLNPGYLGNYDFFRENFVLPIEKEENKFAADSLRKMINPFLLRRTKKVVANELPEKNEIVLKSNFGDIEQENYTNWKNHYKNEIQESIAANGFGKSRMKILEGLMKLRQICLHPKMVDPKYTGTSAKFDLLMLNIKKVLEEGHKVLIFSSFVKMLSIVKDEFEKDGLDYSYLDGKTKNRELVVSKFQEAKEARPFLISIKAGGVGLNLTGADYVFILDPWWNPAVESQAMDRAHRIGQKNNVFVYKMIAENSIEEKILELQNNKKKLVEEIITENSGLDKDIDVKSINEIFG